MKRKRPQVSFFHSRDVQKKLFQFDWWAPKSLQSFRNMTTIFQRDRKLQKKNFFSTPRIIKFVKSPELLYWTKFANWCVKKLRRKKYFNSGPMKGNQGSLVPLHFTVMWRVRETMSYVSGTKFPSMFVLFVKFVLPLICLTSIAHTCSWSQLQTSIISTFYIMPLIPWLLRLPHKFIKTHT